MGRGLNPCLLAFLWVRQSDPRIDPTSVQRWRLTCLLQGGSAPAQNVYQCRLQEEKASQRDTIAHAPPEKHVGVGVASNANEAGLTTANSVHSIQSQVGRDQRPLAGNYSIAAVVFLSIIFSPFYLLLMLLLLFLFCLAFFLFKFIASVVKIPRTIA